VTDGVTTSDRPGEDPPADDPPVTTDGSSPVAIAAKPGPSEAPDQPAAGVSEPAEPSVAVASQRQLMWWRFRKHKLALVATVVVALFYLVAVFADFLAYADPEASEAQRSLMAPQSIHWLDGGFNPYVHPVEGSRDQVTFQRTYEADTSQKLRVRFFAHGYDYKLFGLIKTDIHLLGVEGADAETSLAVLGTDSLGRDVYSRLLLATRTSLTIGLVGVGLSLILGVALGGISGYYGGFIDTIIQRVIEILRSIPTIPLWMGLAAAMPRDWSVTRVYLALTIILSLIGWTELARVVRGRFLQLRREEFVVAAELAGARPRRIIFVHMVPLFASHIIAATTLALPAMIIAETSLSFLGLGLRPPATSWGVMLQQAQNVQTVALSPWLLVPVIPVTLAILAFNFLGDGLRDAADPYS
jgi:peptide/nickel transport system permease protein